MPSITQTGKSQTHFYSSLSSRTLNVILNSVNQMLFAGHVQAGCKAKATPLQYVQAYMTAEGRA